MFSLLVKRAHRVVKRLLRAKLTQAIYNHSLDEKFYEIRNVLQHFDFCLIITTHYTYPILLKVNDSRKMLPPVHNFKENRRTVEMEGGCCIIETVMNASHIKCQCVISHTLPKRTI